MPVFTRKFSEFQPGTLEEDVGLGNGANTRGPASTGSGGTIETITQDTSALMIGRWVRFDDATQLYVHAIATSPREAEVVGVVLSIPSTTQFELQQSGPIMHGTPGFSGFATTGTYFLSDVSLGEMTLVPPTQNGRVRLPVFMPDSADSGWIASLKTGMVIGTPGPIPANGSGGDSNEHTVNQPGNTFMIGDWVRVSADNTYSLADGTSFANSQGVGVVISSGDPLFTVQFAGYNSNTVIQAVDALGVPIPIVASTVYYLSNVVPGAITPVKPTGLFQSVKPSFISESAVNGTGWVLPQQPIENTEDSNDPSITIVTQAGHGFAVEDVVRVSALNTYTKAIANGAVNTRAVGMVIDVIDVDTFILQTSGYTEAFAGLAAPNQYYLSDSVAGGITITEPTAAGSYSKPMFQALNATSGFILEQRPVVAAGGGSVIQIQHANFRDPIIISNAVDSWFTLTGYDLSIAPSSVSSTVRTTFNFCFGMSSSGGITPIARCAFRILRNGSVIVDATSSSGSVINATASINVGTPVAEITIIYYDSPASTGAQTYALQAYFNGGTSTSGSIRLNQPGTSSALGPSTIGIISLEEIA